MLPMIGEGAQPEQRQPWTRILLKAALIAVILLLSLWITASAVDLTIYSAYKRYVDRFSEITRLDPYLANVVFLLFLVPVFFGARSFLFGLRRAKRRAGLAVLITLGLLYNFSLYLVTRNQYFVGTETKYYALVPGGVAFSARPGIEPRYGIPFQPVTPDKIKWLLRIQQGQIQVVQDPARHDWFDGVTRDPVLWYYTDLDGNFHFFDGPGYAPATGDELKPVTPDIRRLWEKRTRGLAEARSAKTAENRAAGSSESDPQLTRQDSARGPTIGSFEAVPYTAGGCEVAILRWAIAGATTASIEPLIGAVNPSSGYKVVRPVQTTRYTLQVKGEGGTSASRDLTFAVSKPPKQPCGPN